MMGAVRELPVFYTPEDIAEMMRCARSTAYEHARRAVGRRPGARGMLRVPKAEWERYVRRLATCGSIEEETCGGAGTTTATETRSESAPVVSIETRRSPKPSNTNAQQSTHYTRAGKPRSSKTR